MMKFSQVKIGHIMFRQNGGEFMVCGIDKGDEMVMAGDGTWYAFKDCYFPSYAVLGDE